MRRSGPTAGSWARSRPDCSCCSASPPATRLPTPTGLAGKVARLRIFENDEGRFDRSALDAGGAALVVSQFTLIADSKHQKGTRPDFSAAARPEVAEPLYEHFCAALRELGVPVQTGVFGARMAVELVNDGPVTIILET